MHKNSNYQALKEKYKHWGILNEEGKKEFGHIFPDGIVPLKILLPENATLEGQEGVHRIYKCDISLLTEEQYTKLVEYMSDKSGVSFSEVMSSVSMDGFIPMSSRWFSGSGTNQTHMFI